jgi:mono/diheme cytochrome c family protein
MDEMFRFIKYGVKMTAMPGFAKTLSDDKIWQLAAFLRTAPGMSPGDFALQTGITAAASTEIKPGGS